MDASTEEDLTILIIFRKRKKKRYSRNGSVISFDDCQYSKDVIQ